MNFKNNIKLFHIPFILSLHWQFFIYASQKVATQIQSLQGFIKSSTSSSLENLLPPKAFLMIVIWWQIRTAEGIFQGYPVQFIHFLLCYGSGVWSCTVMEKQNTAGQNVTSFGLLPPFTAVFGVLKEYP